MRNIHYYQRAGVPAIKLKTVNVLEFSNGEFQQSFSMADNAKGNQRAEKVFRKIIERFEKTLDKDVPRSDKEDFENYIEDGIYDAYYGFTLYLTHSL